ncbi:MAG: hypothetical protein MK165_05415, partial [Pirellulaceae bacterium]|nr:hypothetical protein [Pirellulaceae bacterium]
MASRSKQRQRKRIKAKQDKRKQRSLRLEGLEERRLLSVSNFRDGDRWTETASRSGLQQGDPTTLTWSIAPDGTPVSDLIVPGTET